MKVFVALLWTFEDNKDGACQAKRVFEKQERAMQFCVDEANKETDYNVRVNEELSTVHLSHKSWEVDKGMTWVVNETEMELNQNG